MANAWTSRILCFLRRFRMYSTEEETCRTSGESQIHSVHQDMESSTEKMENPPEKERSRFRASVDDDDDDRISNLPDSVICHILSFLPTRTVVATSILSTRWKFMWTKVMTLDFILDEIEPEDAEEEYIRVKEFVRFVNKVLHYIDSQHLQKFQLKWFGWMLRPGSVAVWISYAISRSVQVLVIHIGHSYDNPLSNHLPGTLFTLATLEVLKVDGCFVLEVPRVVCLPKLEVLDLCHLMFDSNECLPRLISGCPVLHTLKISREFVWSSMQDFRVFSSSLRHVEIYATHDDNVKYEGRLEIDAPNLEYFALFESLEKCLVKRLDSVNFVVLDLALFPDYNHEYDHDYEDSVIEGVYINRCNSVVKLVEAINHVKFLTLKGTIIRALSYATTPLTVCFERLIKLKVSVQCCHWSSLGVLLGRSTKLQVLEITRMYCGGKNTHKLCWNDPTKVPECLSSSLEKVSITDFEGLEDEMTMVKYILQHGEVLESFTFKSAGDPSNYKNKFELLQHVATIPRCSRACQIHFD